MNRLLFLVIALAFAPISMAVEVDQVEEYSPESFDSIEVLAAQQTIEARAVILDLNLDDYKVFDCKVAPSPGEFPQYQISLFDFGETMAKKKKKKKVGGRKVAKTGAGGLGNLDALAILKPPIRTKFLKICKKRGIAPVTMLNKVVQNGFIALHV